MINSPPLQTNLVSCGPEEIFPTPYISVLLSPPPPPPTPQAKQLPSSCPLIGCSANYPQAH